MAIRARSSSSWRRCVVDDVIVFCIGEGEFERKIAGIGAGEEEEEEEEDNDGGPFARGERIDGGFRCDEGE